MFIFNTFIREMETFSDTPDLTFSGHFLASLKLSVFSLREILGIFPYFALLIPEDPQ